MSKYLLRSAAAFTLAAVALAFTPAVRAEDKPAKTEKKEGEKKEGEKPKGHQFTGVIESIDAGAATLTVKKKDESKTFAICPTCKFSVPSKEGATAADFKAGDKIVVQFTEDGGKSVAKKIGLAPAKAPSEKKEKEGKEEKKEK